MSNAIYDATHSCTLSMFREITEVSTACVVCCLLLSLQTINGGEQFAVLCFFWFGGILGSASGVEFPVSPSNHVGFKPRLLYSNTHHSPDSFTHLKTGWAQDARLQWSYENWYIAVCWYNMLKTGKKVETDLADDVEMYVPTFFGRQGQTDAKGLQRAPLAQDKTSKILQNWSEKRTTDRWEDEVNNLLEITQFLCFHRSHRSFYKPRPLSDQFQFRPWCI